MTRKMAFLPLIAFAAFAALQFTKAQTARASFSTTSQSLIALENRWTTAVQNSNVTAVDSIVADSWIGTDEYGERADKQDFLKLLKSGDLKIQSFKISEMHVQVYGNAAVVTGTGDVTETFKSKPIAETFAFTDVFVRQNGHWRAVASHNSIVAKESN